MVRQQVGNEDSLKERETQRKEESKTKGDKIDGKNNIDIRNKSLDTKREEKEEEKEEYAWKRK